MFMCSADTYRADFTSPVSTAHERTLLEILKPISFAVAGPERLATHSRRSVGHCDERHVRRAADGSVAREGRFSPSYRRTGPQGSRRATWTCCSPRGTERTLSPRLSETCIHISDAPLREDLGLEWSGEWRSMTYAPFAITRPPAATGENLSRSCTVVRWS